MPGVNANNNCYFIDANNKQSTENLIVTHKKLKFSTKTVTQTTYKLEVTNSDQTQYKANPNDKAEAILCPLLIQLGRNMGASK